MPISKQTNLFRQSSRSYIVLTLICKFLHNFFQEADHPWSDHQWGLCIFDDLIEYAGPQSLNYQQHFVNQMLHYVCDTQAEVRQAAAYGCGVMGQFGGPNYAQICAQAIPRLVEIIQAQNSRDPENINPTENAISAVTKILKNNSGAINLDEVLPMW